MIKLGSISRSSLLSQRLLFLLFAAVLLFYFILPVFMFAIQVGSADFVATLSDPAVRTAIYHSLITAPIATAIATIFGVPLAYSLVRWSFPGHRIIEIAVLLPMIVPPVVGGAMLLTAVGRLTPIGSAAEAIGIPLTDSLIGVILAQTFVAAPFVIITSRAGFAAINDRYLEVSRTLGRGPIATFLQVSIPMAKKAIIAGVVLTFSRAIGEFGATMMIAYHPRTMPTQIWVSFISDGLSSVVPIAVALFAITLIAVVIIQWIGQRPSLLQNH